MSEPLDPVAVERDLAAFYDLEGPGHLERAVDPRREQARRAFVERLAGIPAPTVLEVGPGPGRDAAAFVAAGIRHVGLELSLGHARLCARTGSLVVAGSVRAVPLVAHAVAAVWSMSTLMHVPNSAIEPALAELARTVVPGGLMAIGVWGGIDDESPSAHDLRFDDRPARLFSRRSDATWVGLLSTIGTLESFETWGADEEFHYQLAVLHRG